MQFFVLALVALPFLVDALETGVPISISKRSSLHSSDGRIDVTRVHSSRHYTIEFVSVILFKEKVEHIDISALGKSSVDWMLSRGTPAGPTRSHRN